MLELLQKKPYAEENINEEIMILLEELYFNIYHTYMGKNIYIEKIKNKQLIDRYYFNSAKISNYIPSYLEGKNVFLVSKELSFEEFEEYKDNVLIKWQDESCENTKPLEEAVKLGEAKLIYREKIRGLTNNEVTYLEANGFKVEYYGTLAIPEDTFNDFIENKDQERFSPKNDIYDVIYLETIYETFPDQKINVSELKKF